MTQNKGTPVTEEVLQAKITQETARIAWRELQRFFAAGKAVAVASDLDLVQVAAELANDNKYLFEQWLSSQQVAPVTDEQAGQWYAEDRDVWAVVVAPWVLVQVPDQG